MFPITFLGSSLDAEAYLHRFLQILDSKLNLSSAAVGSAGYIKVHPFVQQSLELGIRRINLRPMPQQNQLSRYVLEVQFRIDGLESDFIDVGIMTLLYLTRTETKINYIHIDKNLTSRLEAVFELYWEQLVTDERLKMSQTHKNIQIRRSRLKQRADMYGMINDTITGLANGENVSRNTIINDLKEMGLRTKGQGPIK